MIFWRKKNNITDQEREEQEQKLLHRPGEPQIEPEKDSDPALDPEFISHELAEGEREIIDELEEIPLPRHSRAQDAREARELADHSEEGGWFSRLTRGLSKTTARIGEGLDDILNKRRLDGPALVALEEALIAADLGPAAAARVVEAFSEKRFERDTPEAEVRAALAESIGGLLEPVARPLKTPRRRSATDGPHVILVCGVNGVGKTTTIGKLCHYLHLRQHRKVMIAAADTFRAAAVEQLGIWAERTKTPLVTGEIGADAAAVAFSAYEKARKEGVDILLIDTAGRLHNKSNLMAELEKIIRVLKKQDPSAPHDVLLVLDATTGQNAFAQVKAFQDIVKVTGLIVTKLDGSARGGVVVGLAETFQLPIHAVGVGEGIEDLQAFEPQAYARALAGL